MLAAIVHLAHVLNFEVIAEGAETREQADLLFELECDYIQGFYFARPQTATEATDTARNGLAGPPRTTPAGRATNPARNGGVTTRWPPR